MPTAALPFDAEFNPRKLRGAPILPDAHTAGDLRITATTPAEFTEPARRPVIPRTIAEARGIVIFHLADGAFIGEDPGTIRRVAQVDLDRDLDAVYFKRLVTDWPRMGRFPHIEARDAWLEALDVMLRDAGLTD